MSDELKPLLPAQMSDEQFRKYVSSLKVGERVIETGKSCMAGAVGTVYIWTNEETCGSKCVMWGWPKDVATLGTSVTHGTRRIKEVLDMFNTRAAPAVQQDAKPVRVKLPDRMEPSAIGDYMNYDINGRYLRRVDVLAALKAAGIEVEW